MADASVGGIQWPLLGFYLAMSVAGGLGMLFGIGGLFELVYYRRRREQADEWKCQPRRWPSDKMRRQELKLGAANMTAASLLSGLFAYYVATGGYTSIYFNLREHGIFFSVASTLVYFLATDCALYWAHRLFHRPAAFRAIHRVHHKFTSPTAFTSAAMHPVEFFTYQSVMLIPLFFFPIHVVGLVFVLVYQNYVALVDHSGVKMYSWFPWQPPSQFHDDHHVHFHVNYGQNMGLWDRVFGTWRRVGRKYGVDVFGGKGVSVDGTKPELAPLVVYGRPPKQSTPVVGQERPEHG